MTTTLKHYLLGLALCFCHCISPGQLASLGPHLNIDSLQTLLKTGKDDTNKVFQLYNLARELTNQNLDTAILLSTQALELSEKQNWEKGTAYSYIVLGWCSDQQGNYPKTLDCYYKALRIGEKTENKKIISTVLGTLGGAYREQGDYTKALDYHFKALKMDEELENKWGIARNLGFIGMVYYNQQDYFKALDYYFRALKIMEEIGNKNGVAVWLGFIGNVYKDQDDYPKALDYYFKSLKMLEGLGNKNKIGIAEYLCGIGSVYTSTKRYKESYDYLYRALALSDSVGAMYDVKNCYEALSSLYENSDILLCDTIGGKLLNTKQMIQRALYYNKRYISVRDTLFNKERQKQIMNFEFEKKETVEKAKQEKKDAIAQKELQKQKMVRNGFIGGTILFLLLAGAIFMGLRKTGKAKKKSEELLLNILPAEVADELKSTGTAKAKSFTMVTVMFTDFKDFTTVSEKVSAELLVDEIHTCFSAFDNILQKHKIEKIKTIGDAYLCASGLPVSNFTHAVDMLNAAFEIRDYMLQRKKEKEARGEIPFELRIGIHTGPVVAGIVGVRKFAYDIWGDTVNLAARMEQNSEAGKVNISRSTYELVKDKFNCIHRGKIQAKNKGEIDMYFVEDKI